MFPLSVLRELAEERAYLRPHGQIVTSPWHLTVAELLRREALGSEAAGGVPVDVFVFAAGEPPAPHLTKIGGVPFRSRRKPWPTTADGRPLAFVGQLAFVDSRDILAGLPGDVLLVFVDAENRAAADSYVCEWVSLDEGDVLSKSELPEIHYTWRPGVMAQKRGLLPERRRFELFVCHGHIHRTVDMPDDEARFAAYPNPYRISVLEATKIGGVPRGIQGAPSVAGRFVASIASVQPIADVAYPWVNEADPLTPKARNAIPTWSVGDMGSVYLFEDGGRLRWDVHSY
jgi:hypothetical protein